MNPVTNYDPSSANTTTEAICQSYLRASLITYFKLVKQSNVPSKTSSTLDVWPNHTVKFVSDLHSAARLYIPRVTQLEAHDRQRQNRHCASFHLTDWATFQAEGYIVNWSLRKASTFCYWAAKEAKERTLRPAGFVLLFYVVCRVLTTVPTWKSFQDQRRL